MEEDEFKAKIEDTSDFDELIKLYEADAEDDHELTGHKRLFERALGLVATTTQAIALWDVTGGLTSELKNDDKILEKMVESIKTQEEVFGAYAAIALEEKELERRRFIRMIFDKADELGYPIL